MRDLLKASRLFMALMCLAALPLAFAQTDEPAPESSAKPGLGDTVKPFTLNDDNGDLWSLKDHLGKGYIVVYFYPAAMTGGCTAQACAYRDKMESLEAEGVEVVGVSGDSVNSLKIFKKAHSLNFTLLSDVSATAADALGVPHRDEVKSFTRMLEDLEVTLTRSLSTSRWTFILDKEGKIIYRNEKVNAGNDSEEVLAFIKQHEAGK